MRSQINTLQKETPKSSFNTGGAFSGGNADGLRAGIDAAMQVMGKNNNTHDHFPKEATPEIIYKAAADVLQNAVTIQDKNNIVRRHYNDLGLEDSKKNTASVAAFEKAVMRKLGK